MKNSPYFFISLLFGIGASLVSGCEKENENPVCGEESKEYVFFENRFLDIFYPTTQNAYPSVATTEGDSGKIVFQYLRFVDESKCPWSDGGQGDWMVFEVGEDLVEFDFEKEELKSANAFAGGYSGFAGSFLMQAVQEGKIAGKKLNQSEWHITVDISVNGHSYQFEKKFKLQ
jgi:hypothetical protein